MYVSPLFSIVQKHGVFIHMYADDTQLYINFLPPEWSNVKSKMEACISEIREWLKWNCLKLNDGKTEMMIIEKNCETSKIDGKQELCIGDTIVKPTSKARNIGGEFDSEMKMM